MSKPPDDVIDTMKVDGKYVPIFHPVSPAEYDAYVKLCAAYLGVPPELLGNTKEMEIRRINELFKQQTQASGLA